MFPRNLKAVGLFTAGALPLLSPPALAAPPGMPSAVSVLGLSGQQISANELSKIRGGFDLSPSLSISFAFRQIEAINGIVVSSIVVPETNVTAAAAQTSTAASSITPSLTSTSSSSPALTVTNANGDTQTVTPSASGAVNLTTTANNGLTTINTQLGANGLSNLTTNQANNTAVSVAATMNINISGLSQFLTQQQSFANTQAGLYYAGSAFK